MPEMTHHVSHSPKSSDVTALDRKLAVPMFVVALMFLIIAGFLLPTMLYHDAPPGIQREASATAPASSDWLAGHSDEELHEELLYFVPGVRRILAGILLVLYLILAVEGLAHWWTGGKHLRQHIAFLFAPFLRLSSRDHIDGSHVWIVGVGWQKSSLVLEKKLANAFSIPMVAMALPVLPLVIIQLFWSSKINSQPELKFLMATATAIIWMAFVFEFSIMFTVAKRKWKYCKEHWINLLVVVLPMFGFLRLAALGNVLRLNQLAKTASVLRLRGLSIRLWRGTMSLGIIDKALRKSPKHKIDKLNRMIDEKEEELELLRWELTNAIEKSKQQIARKKIGTPISSSNLPASELPPAAPPPNMQQTSSEGNSEVDTDISPV